MRSDCDIQVELEGWVWVVSLHGQHHQGTVDRLDDEIEQVVATGTTIVLDLTDVTFVDGHLVAAILRWANRAQISDHEALAVVVGEAPSVAGRGFNIVLGSTARLPCFATKPEALTALSEASARTSPKTSDSPPRESAAQPSREQPLTERPPVRAPGRPSSRQGDAKRIGDQRSAALVQANDVRRRRAALKHSLKTGEETLAAVFSIPLTTSARLALRHGPWPPPASARSRPKTSVATSGYSREPPSGGSPNDSAPCSRRS